MKIQILGAGCPNCKILAANTEQAVQDLGLETEVEKVTEIDDILDLGVMMTPALRVDGEVKSAGKALTPEQVAKILKESL